MRWIVLRVLGADVIELGIGREDDDTDSDTVEVDTPPQRIGAVYGSHASDIGYAPGPFRFGFNPNDEPVPEWTDDDE